MIIQQIINNQCWWISDVSFWSDESVCVSWGQRSVGYYLCVCVFVCVCLFGNLGVLVESPPLRTNQLRAHYLDKTGGVRGWHRTTTLPGVNVCYDDNNTNTTTTTNRLFIKKVKASLWRTLFKSQLKHNFNDKYKIETQGQSSPVSYV